MAGNEYISGGGEVSGDGVREEGIPHFRGSYAQKRYHQSMYLCHRAQRGNPSFDGYAGGSWVKYDGRQGEYGQELSGLPAGRVGGGLCFGDCGVDQGCAA